MVLPRLPPGSGRRVADAARRVKTGIRGGETKHDALIARSLKRTDRIKTRNTKSLTSGILKESDKLSPRQRAVAAHKRRLAALRRKKKDEKESGTAIVTEDDYQRKVVEPNKVWGGMYSFGRPARKDKWGRNPWDRGTADSYGI